ncbi:unnamed protein product [Urochloa humidicola]
MEAGEAEATPAARWSPRAGFHALPEPARCPHPALIPAASSRRPSSTSVLSLPARSASAPHPQVPDGSSSHLVVIVPVLMDSAAPAGKRVGEPRAPPPPPLPYLLLSSILHLVLPKNKNKIDEPLAVARRLPPGVAWRQVGRGEGGGTLLGGGYGRDAWTCRWHRGAARARGWRTCGREQTPDASHLNFPLH